MRPLKLRVHKKWYTRLSNLVVVAVNTSKGSKMRNIVLGLVVASLLFVCVVESAYCSGNPKTLNGLNCASTTRYWDNQEGACGYVFNPLFSPSSLLCFCSQTLSCRCGTDGSHPFSFQWLNYTAAGSPPVFGSGTWCGSGCGK